MKKKLSIIIPMFNCEKTIEECIKGIACQCDDSVEIILVDDGSTDNTSKICQRFSDLDDRIVYKKKINGGVSSARNVGIETASGKYIMFVDGDDVVPDNYFDSFLQKMSQVDDKVFVLSRIATHYLGDNKVIIEGTNLEEGKYLRTDKLVDVWNEHLWNSPVNKIYLRKILIGNNIRFDAEIRIGEDWLFNNAYVRALKPQTFYILDNVVYDYYLDSNPWRHCKEEEFYEINKKQVEDFKLTLVELNISSKEFDKFDKRDLDFTISEIRRVARDSKMSGAERIKKIGYLSHRENVKKRIVRHGKLYSNLDRVEFALGNATFVFLWENTRKKLGKIRNGGSSD